MHPVTIYGFALALVTLVGLIVLTALGDVSSDVSLPIMSGLAGMSAGVAGGVAVPSAITNGQTGTVTLTDPNA